jgi:hypothetical protein
MLRGHKQTLRIYGSRMGDPIILSSGDGGWIHLAPHVAELLAQCGFQVIGFDARAYLSSFTSSTETLSPQDVIDDYATLIQLAERRARRAPLGCQCSRAQARRSSRTSQESSASASVT